MACRSLNDPCLTSHSIPHYPSSLICFLHRICHQVPFDASASLFLVHLLPPLKVNSKRAGTRQAPSKHPLQMRVPFLPAFPGQTMSHSHLDQSFSPDWASQLQTPPSCSTHGRNSLPRSSSNFSTIIHWLPCCPPPFSVF